MFRLPGEKFGLQLSDGRGAQPSDPVISRFNVVAPTPDVRRLLEAADAAGLLSDRRAPEPSSQPDPAR